METFFCLVKPPPLVHAHASPILSPCRRGEDCFPWVRRARQQETAAVLRQGQNVGLCHPRPGLSQVAHDDLGSCVDEERFLVCLKRNQKAYLLILNYKTLACFFLWMVKDEKNRLPFLFFFHNVVSGLVHLPQLSQAADWHQVFKCFQHNQPEAGSPLIKRVRGESKPRAYRLKDERC